MGRRQLFYQAVVEAPQAPPAAPNTPSSLEWLSPLSTPDPMVRRLSAAIVASGMVFAPVSPPAVTTNAPAAIPGIGQPAKKRQLFYQSQTQVFPPAPTTQTPNTLGWLSPLAEPPRNSGLPIAMAGFLTGNGPLGTVASSITAAWYRQLDEPTKRKQFIQDYHVRSFTQPAPPTVPPFGWFTKLDEPVRGPRVHPGFITPVLAATAPPDRPPFGWFVALNEPVKGPKVHQGFVTPVLPRSEPPPPALESWYRQLDEPPKRKPILHVTPDMPLPVLGPVSAPPVVVTPPGPTWTDKPGVSGTQWTKSSGAGGSWNKQNSASGTWTDKGSNSGSWTDTTPSGGTWTKK